MSRQALAIKLIKETIYIYNCVCIGVEIHVLIGFSREKTGYIQIYNTYVYIYSYMYIQREPIYNDNKNSRETFNCLKTLVIKSIKM